MIKKVTTLISGAVIAIAMLAPISVHALSTATMSLAGSSNTNGTFAVTVYENTGSDTVTSANVSLDFSAPVSNVSYDYSVGPFVATTPSGAHNAYGTVTGQQPVALVRFTVSSPMTVTATVGAASYLKHADTTTGSIESFNISRGSADFTYSAPAQGGMGGGSSTPSPSNNRTAAPISSATSNPTAQSGQVESAATDNSADASQSDTEKKNTTSNPAEVLIKKHDKGGSKTPWVIGIVAILAAAIGGAYAWSKRKVAPVAPAPTKSAATKVTKPTTAKKGSAAKTRTAARRTAKK